MAPMHDWKDDAEFIRYNPPLRSRWRVVTHSPMLQRIDKTRALMVVVALGAFYLYTQHEAREALRTGDYSRCWTDSCKSDITFSR